ncbi:MAG: sulfurtransferase-like selenium metabolism protein YedF [Syntrophales bacterium]|nr:sulfurtransferase-like selenium metabolism protein YedF [Syntrophales bacterium]MDD5234226.1 sulfurtransferase-like selenium metabolism protein YedF [Syntrophales bacterium]
METIIDCRGLTCPQPVILTKNALNDQDKVTVIVDNDPAMQNVRRLATKMGCQLQMEKKEDGTYHIRISRSAAAGKSAETAPAAADAPLIIAVSSDRMGRGSDELGDVLIRSYIHTILELDPLPDTMIFYNTGVKLAVRDSAVLDDLKELEAAGVSIIVCGTCLNYFGLTDSIAAGVVSNMYEIASTMASAGRLVTP